MTEQQDVPKPLHPEFFLRVNDFIEMANRIERRHDSHHAELAFLHAFARYSAHHFRQVGKGDTLLERERFADYISAEIRQFVLKHLQDLVGDPAPSDPQTQGDSETTA